MKFIRRKKKGFTLIELLAVIVVLTVISMIGYTLQYDRKLELLHFESNKC